MSCQSVIDKALSKEGRFQRTITVIGEAGSASIPEGCVVDFRDSQISSLTAGRGSTVVIGQCNVSGSVTMQGGQLTLSDSTVQGDLHLNGTKATQNRCTVVGQVFLDQGASLDAYSNTRTGSGTGITASNNSRVVLTEDTITSYDIAVDLSSHSFLSARNSTLFGIKKGVRLTGSQAEVYGGTLRGHDDIALEALSNSKALVSGMQTDVLGTRASIYADSSYVRVANVQKVTGDEVGIICLNNGEVEVIGFQQVVGLSDFAVKAESQGKVTASRGEKLVSPAADAVHLNAATFTARSLQSIQSQGGNAIHSDGGSTVTLNDIAIEIRGYAGNGIEAGTGDSYEVSRCPLVRGDSGSGIKGGDGNRFVIREVQTIYGQSADGVTLGQGNSLTLTAIQTIEGVSGSAIRSGASLTLLFSNVQTLLGDTGDGLTLGASCHVRGRGFTLIQGKNGTGVVVDSGSDVEFRDFTKIQGDNGEGITAPSSKVILLGPSAPTGDVLGLNGAGCHLAGAGGSFRAERLNRIAGQATGNGVQVNGGQIYISGVNRIDGPANAVAFADGTVGEVRQCTALTGGDGAGVFVSGGGVAVASRISKLAGTGKGGAYSENSELTVSDVALLTGSPNSVRCVNSQVTVLNCPTLQGDLVVEGSSSVLTVTGCTLQTGNVLATDGSGRFVRLQVQAGSLQGSNADIRCEGVTLQAGSATLSNCSFFAVHLNLSSGTLTANGSGVVCVSCSAGGLEVGGGGVLGVACDFGPVTLTDAPLVNIGGGGPVTGTGATFLALAADFTLPVAGLSIDSAGTIHVRAANIDTETS